MGELLCSSDHKAIWFNIITGQSGLNKFSRQILARFLSIEDRELHKNEAINKKKAK